MSTKKKEVISNQKGTEVPKVDGNLIKYQYSVFLITYLAYVVFYLCRKPLSVVKTRLEGEGITLMALGVMDTLHLAMYTIGQFVNGTLVDQKGPRWILGLGLWLTGVSVAFVGIIGYLPWNPYALSVIICLLWGANGFGQSTGWPGCVSALSPWFKNNRGTVMGVWTTSYTIGGIGGTLLTTILVEQYDWKIAFIVPAVIAILAGFFSSTLLINNPSEVGYDLELNPLPPDSPKKNLGKPTPPLSDSAKKNLGKPTPPLSDSAKKNLGKLTPPLSDSAKKNLGKLTPPLSDSAKKNLGKLTPPLSDSAKKNLGKLTPPLSDSAKKNLGKPTPPLSDSVQKNFRKSYFSLMEVFKLKGIMYVSWSYFCIKLIRYALLFWLPYYLSNVLQYPETTAGYMSTWFEVGGIFGGVILGWMSDKFEGPRVGVAAPCILMVGVGLGLFLKFSGVGLFLSGLFMSLIGFFTVAPEILLSGVVVQEIGGDALVGRASGVVNGMGSLGSTLQGVLVASIASLGWHYVFYLLIALSVMGFVCLIPPCLWAIRQDEKKRN